MRRWIHLSIPVLAASAAPVVAAIYGSELTNWLKSVQTGWPLPASALLATALLLLPIPAALLFNQVRLVLLALMGSGILMLIHPQIGNLETPLRHLVMLVTPIQILLLLLLRERGLLNRFGLIRLAVVSVPLLTVWLARAPLAKGLTSLTTTWPWLLQPWNALDAPWPILVLLPTTIFVMMRLKGTEYPVIAPGFAAVATIVTLAVASKNTLWFSASTPVVLLCGFGAAGLIMLWCVYLLSWGRAYRDELTGLPGRRALEEKLAKLVGSYSLAMGDVDHFKRFNDKYGHDTGDDVLRMVGGILERHTPGIAYRYGGEEFTIVCNGLTAREAAERLEEARQKIAETQLTLRQRGGKERKTRGKVSVTMSFGVAQPNEHNRHPKDVLKAADKALYKAKRTGRNRIKSA